MVVRAFRERIHYFDLSAWAVELMVAVGVLGGGWSRPWTDWAALAVFAMASCGVGVFRQRALAQRVPWLTTAFAASAAVALVVAFSRWHTLWLMLALSLGVVLLAVGAIARGLPLSARLSRSELFTLASLAIGAILVVVLLEGLVRAGMGLFAPEFQQLMRINPSNYGVAHPYIGHLHTPDSSFVVTGRDFEAIHHVDEAGFRNDWPWPAPPVDVVVVGDSVSFGYGVSDDQAWPALLAGSMSGTQQVNLSLVGGTPQQYLRVFETFGLDLQPKVLLVAVWAKNDFADAGGFDAWERSGVGGNFMVWRDFGRPEKRLELNLRRPLETLEGAFRNGLYPVMRRSYLYNLIWALQGGYDGSAPGSRIVLPFPDGSRIQMAPGVASDATRQDRHEFALMLDALTRLHALAAMHSVRTVMVLQPSKEEVYLPLVMDGEFDLAVDLRRALDERGIEYVDLLPGFRAAARGGERLYREVDTHPNEDGYALIAELVHTYLEGRRTVAPSGTDQGTTR